MSDFSQLFSMGVGAVALALPPLEETFEGPTLDRAFITQAEASGQMEIELSKLAVKNTVDARVRRFAERMLVDRSRLAEKLARAAEEQGTASSPQMKPYQRSTVDWIGSLRGRDFDREYVQFAAMDEESMAEQSKLEATSGKAPRLKWLARNLLPTLQGNLARADRVEARIAPSTNS